MRFPLACTLALTAASLVATPRASADDDALSLTLKDHHFDPAAPVIPADKRMKVTVTNLDPTAAEFESDDFKAEKLVPAGKEVSFYIGPLKAGTYEFHDEYHEDVSKTHLTAK